METWQERNMETRRKPFQGVLNILDFNRHFYIGGLAMLTILLASAWFFQFPRVVNLLMITGFVYGLLMPLVVSAYVYDFSGYYRFDWLIPLIDTQIHEMHVANIHAGFDETSVILHRVLPGSKISAFDFYDPEHHTEAAIRRARDASTGYPDTQRMKTGHLPLPAQSVEVVFLLSAVHEIRSDAEKIEFLKECRRICKPGGKIIMVEHLRDFPNFLAFTIGFTHFFSRKTWLKVLHEAGFQSVHERKFTPFMSIFHTTCSY
jgi:SAM-dependent methyltransferase